MKFVDVDGHILEPSDLWTAKLEPEYRNRAIRIERDEKGLESWSIDGEIYGFLSNGTSAKATEVAP